MNILASLPKGRAATDEKVKGILDPLIEIMLDTRSAMDFSPTLRGWCYVLEGRGLITKGEFGPCEARITMARKRGWLSLDITAEDETRSIRGLPHKTDEDPRRHLRLYLNAAVDRFAPYGPNEYRRKYVEVMVEKLDLLNLFARALGDYGVGIVCSRGWADLHSRAAMLKRFKEAEDWGQDCVLLVYGDFDPGGLSITENLRGNLVETLPAAGLLGMPEIEIVRVGLNYEDIERLGLTWIDGLETSGGKDLSHPSHRQHRNTNVQEYLRKFGARKCEANALIVRPQEADRIIREALSRHIKKGELRDWRHARSEARQIISRLAESFRV